MDLPKGISQKKLLERGEGGKKVCETIHPHGKRGDPKLNTCRGKKKRGKRARVSSKTMTMEDFNQKVNHYNFATTTEGAVTRETTVGWARGGETHSPGEKGDTGKVLSPVPMGKKLESRRNSRAGVG